MEEESTDFVKMDKDISVTAVSEGSADFVRIKQEVDLPEDDTYYPMDFGISVEDEEEMNPVYVKMKSKEPGSSERANCKSTAARGRLGRGKAKSKSLARRGRSRASATSYNPTSPGLELEHATGWESSEEEYLDSHRAEAPHGASPNGGSQPRRHKVHSDLTNEDEESMVEWIRETECLYNKKRIDYRDFQQKDKLWADKAKELGKKVNVLKVWYKSIRTRYVRISRKKSRYATTELTERDDWVMKKFSFLAKHIGKVRTNFRNSGLPQQNLNAASSVQTGSRHPDIAHRLIDDEGPAGNEEPTLKDHMNLTSLPAVPYGPVHGSGPDPGSKDGSMDGPKQGPKAETCAAEVEDEAPVPCISQRYEQFIQMQERVLMSMLQPRVVNERTTYADWMKNVVEGFDRSVWREFQYECSQLIYKYQCRNDQVLNGRPSQLSASKSASSSEQL